MTQQIHSEYCKAAILNIGQAGSLLCSNIRALLIQKSVVNNSVHLFVPNLHLVLNLYLAQCTSNAKRLRWHQMYVTSSRNIADQKCQMICMHLLWHAQTVYGTPVIIVKTNSHLSILYPDGSTLLQWTPSSLQ